MPTGDTAGPSLASSDFDSIPIGSGLRLYIHPTHQYKSTRIDIFISRPLEPLTNTKRALLARLLERGTTSYPDMRSINRFVDDLYGASFGIDVEQYGEYQVVHISLEVVDSRYLPAKSNVLKSGFDFLGEVLRSPHLNGAGGFPENACAQEKVALRKSIDNIYSDKMAYAQRRCVEEMCRGEAFGLAPYGKSEELSALDAVELIEFHFDCLARERIDLYVSGPEPADLVERYFREICDWPRSHQPFECHRRTATETDSPPRELVECQDIRQGKLVIGYRSGARIEEFGYEALVLFNLLLGSDVHSRLHQSVRERSGLCYQIGSFLEPMCGMMFVEAGVDAQDSVEAVRQIDEQIDWVRTFGPTDEELELARAVAVQRLHSMSDDREALMCFHFQRQLAGVAASRRDLCARLNSVSAADVAEAANQVTTDTIFFLSNAGAVSGLAGQVAIGPR